MRTFLSPWAWTAAGALPPVDPGPMFVWPVTTRIPRSFRPRIRDEFIVEDGHDENDDPYLDTGVP